MRADLLPILIPQSASALRAARRPHSRSSSSTGTAVRKSAEHSQALDRGRERAGRGNCFGLPAGAQKKSIGQEDRGRVWGRESARRALRTCRSAFAPAFARIGLARCGLLRRRFAMFPLRTASRLARCGCWTAEETTGALLCSQTVVAKRRCLQLSVTWFHAPNFQPG